MDLLLILRALTLGGWCVLTAALLYIVRASVPALPAPSRRAWAVVAGKHFVVAVTTVVIEGAWLLHTLAPTSSAAGFGRMLYNPVYLFNGVIGAVVPHMVVGLLLRGDRGRYVYAAIVVMTILFTAVPFSGAVQDWTTLMVASQVLAFVAIVGYLSFWAGFFLGHLRHTDVYLRGLMAVLTLFHILLPIQTEFFELVGRIEVQKIWHLHEFLQLALVTIELAIVLAFINHVRNTRAAGSFSQLVGADG